MNTVRKLAIDRGFSDWLCNVIEAAQLLALSRSKVYELMDAGLLVNVKIGRSRRIPISALRQLIDASRVCGGESSNTPSEG